MKSLEHLKQQLENTNEAIQFFEKEIQRRVYIWEMLEKLDNAKDSLMMESVLEQQRAYNNMLDVLHNLHTERLGLLYQINYYQYGNK